ncbi:TonB-dependent receptor [Erythrobacter sp. EC-HK427]|uniref:TonB-dependent receptor n=1 Tax=Erythrobacter sp. EC-HK427 TaxID=2038396 RepID=UPI001F3B9CA9|nr:TonB-dependent receptor [Erythrobacter sp. EC-HK427]
MSSLALCAVVSNGAFAQDADPEAQVDPEDENVIVVSGFRASLESAQDFKENADTVVDVITAEDIGALADRSVAEALQRVPGVNISRFEQRDDPDRFSVEGSNVIIRGLPYVLSNLNGRDIFSANGGRTLSFNDVSPELLGRVEIYKNVSADMIEGNISGLVNLVTRRPLDRPGFHVAGTIEGNYGDLAQEWSPGFSGLISNTFDTGIGTFGLQLGYSQQELVTRTDASQLTDPCYRADTFDSGCLRVVNVGSGGYFGNPNFDETNFPPAGTVVVPKGAGVRTTTLTRDRRAYSATGQFESNDGAFVVTLEYLRAEVEGSLSEFAALALVNDDGLFPVPAAGSTWTFDGPVFQTGVLTQLQPFVGNQAGGIPTELLRFNREDEAVTEDFSFDVDMELTDRLTLNFEGQYISSSRSEDGFISAMQTYTDVQIDNTGETPQVTFLEPGTGASNASYFNDPARTFYWFLLDNQVRNEGDLYSLRADLEYDISDDGFFRTARFGARWAERNRVTRTANFSNWGNLGAPWTGRGGNWNCGDFQAFGCGGAYVFDFPNSAEVRNPFGDNFQRGAAPTPLGDGSAFFFGSDNVLDDYLSGAVRTQANEITAFTLTPNAWFPISARGGAVDGPFLPGEISDVDETTRAAYARVDFGTDFANGWELSGNIGIRYVETLIGSEGEINFPFGNFFDTDQNGTVSQAEIAAACGNVQPGQQAPGYCSLSAGRQAEFAAAFTGEVIDDSDDIAFDNWLPSFNVKLDFGGGFLTRFAYSTGISRPDLSDFRTGGAIFDNSRSLELAGAEALANGPLFAIFTGNRLLRPIESDNFDLSFEYYFDDVGSITAAVFQKDFRNLFGFGPTVRPFTSPSGVTVDVEVNGPVNFGTAQLRGVELAYQDVWEFLPGPLQYLGGQFTYTYIDSNDFSSDGDVFGQLPQPGISEHTVNATLFYEVGGFSARAAYNWRSEFLQTPRDVIFPFSPIWGESTGQLDGSIFYDITDNITIGVQGVNLLDEVTQTSSVIDFDGTRIIRSAYRNDRRFTGLVRFSF